MFHTFAFCSLCFCHLVGVFAADELKSVKEGDSVTLQINVTGIQTDDRITWTFGTNRSRLAKTDGVTITISDGPDGRFRDRLKLDIKTGSLTITNITTEHAGVYEVQISCSSSETKRRFTVTVYGLFADELKSESVKEGGSVTLQTNTEIQSGDEITWTFGTNRSRLAETDGVTIAIFYHLDERFRDRLKLDKKTGSLTITNIRNTDSGLYEVHISGRSSETKCRFNVTVYGVFGADELKSVKEGDSVTLEINVTEIKTGDEIMWTFGTNRDLIAETDGVTINIPDVLDGRFKDRLKLDHQTGSLTITNTRTEHAGIYEVIISGRSSETKCRFTVSVYGVFGDELSVSVMEGDSVTLPINVTEIKTGDAIIWTFGTNRDLLAETDGVTIKIPHHLDERFKDRLKLDKKTGSLTITNIRNTDSGLYEVIISRSSSETKHRFNVTVYDSTFCCHVSEVVTRLVISAVVGLATVFILVYDITSRKAEQETT